MNASKVVSRSVVSGCSLHWGDVSFGAGKLWAFLFVEFFCLRGGLFLLAEFFCVCTPACGDFLLAEVFWFVNFSCSRNFPVCGLPLLVEFTCSGFLLRIFHRLSCASDSGSLHFLWPIVSSRIFLHRYLQPLTSHVYGVRRMIR